MKRVLIIYAPYGSGHKTIANYIGNYFEENDDNIEIKILDVAKYANALGKLSIKGFDFVIKHRTSNLFSFIYDVADNSLASFNQFKVMKKAFDNAKIRKEIVDFSPDLTISTHFFGGNLVSYYNKLGLTDSKLMTVITDYASHSYWRKDHENQDAFIVANAIVKNEMVKKGINTNKIYDFGLPFEKNKIENLISKEKIFYKYDLDATKKTFLFFGGGTAGSMANFEYLKALIKLKLPINIIFVSGKNQNLENKSRSYIINNNIKNVKVLGFVNDVYSLMNVSDAVITKPGGATITECMDMKVPLILIKGNGGPEKYNAKFICKKKYGTKAYSIIKLCWVVKSIVKDDSKLKFWKENLLKEKKNESTKKIYDLSIELLK